MVSNAGQTTTTAYYSTGDWSVAQAFTTGASSGGYTLGSIDVVVNVTQHTQATRDSIRAELWDATTGGVPGSKVADLAVPAHPLSAGTVSFAAPANTTLTAGTTYYAVFYTVGQFNMSLSPTNSDSEDSGGATGWSIADGARNVRVDVPTSTTTWGNQHASSISITVNGEPSTTKVSISASPTDVDEGSPVTVTLTLSEALSSSVTVPLTITDGSAEPRDHGRLASITIPANSTTATGTITTRHDSDIRDETFTVSLGTLSSETGTVSLEALPPELAAGSPSSVEITILDDDYPIDTVPDLPIDYSKQRPASERQPTGEGAGSSFCYLGSGNGTTEYIRYSDGRIVETTKQSDAIRSMFACD